MTSMASGDIFHHSVPSTPRTKHVVKAGTNQGRGKHPPLADRKLRLSKAVPLTATQRQTSLVLPPSLNTNLCLKLS